MEGFQLGYKRRNKEFGGDVKKDGIENLIQLTTRAFGTKLIHLNEIVVKCC